MYDSKQQTYTKTEYDIVRAENEDLCDNIDAVRQERADYLNGTREGKLQDENKRLRQELHEIEAVACGETQIESDGVYDDGDGMKWIYDKIQALNANEDKESDHAVP